jgi:anti-sigma factor (TIGR02949 family)
VSCELAQSVLHGYIDGELDAARAAEFERHLPSCPECVAALEAQEALRSAMQRADLYERAPVAFRRKLYAELGRPAPGLAPVSIAATSRSSSWRWFGVAAAFLLAAFLGWRLTTGLRGSSAEAAYASAIVDAHLRSLQPGHLEDVVSTDQHTVKPWFDGKLDFAPPVRDFASDGFPLQGGRLDVVHGRSVAVLVYARRKHFINVFIWPTAEGDTAPRSGSQLGYQWVDWRKGGMEMCAVSDVNSTDLDALQRLLTE